MSNALTSPVFRALSSLGRTPWTRGRLFPVSAGKYHHQRRRFRLHSTQSATEHTVQPRLKRVQQVPHAPSRLINNLDPRSVHPEDFLDLSCRHSVRCHFSKEDMRNLRDSFSFLPKRGSGGTRRFPEDCRGFLYFHKDPRGRPNVSGIRFRIAQEPTQAGFDGGEDYCPAVPNEPWSYSILKLAGDGSTDRGNILRRLYQDGLVDPAYVAKWLRILETSGLLGHRYGPSLEHLLMSFDDPFEVDLSIRYLIVYVLDSQKSRLTCYTLRVIPLFEEKAPYKGRCIIRLEKLGEESSNGISYVTFNIRVLKTLTPIECTIPSYEDILPPEAGSLISNSNGPVKRRFLTKPKKVNSKPKHIPPGYQISTLDPKQLKPCDQLEIHENAKRKSVWTSAKAVKTRVIGLQETPVPSFNFVTWEKLGLGKYALGKKGYLYFRQSHPHNPMSGSIRFRLAEQPTFEAFHQGKDLIHPLTGSPWDVTLLRLVQVKNFQPLVAQLLQDGLITQEIVDKCKRLYQHSPMVPSHLGSAVLYELGQPFVMDLRRAHHVVYYIDPDETRLWHLRRTLKNPLASHFRWNSCPYTGQCLVRLEELPAEASSGFSRDIKTVQFRVLKVLEPLNWRDPNKTLGELPVEGSLLSLKALPGGQANVAYLIALTGLKFAGHGQANV